MYANCLVILQQWQQLEELLEEFDEPSVYAWCKSLDVLCPAKIQ